MPSRMSLEAYLAGAETTQPQELVWGILRQPPAPGYPHQIAVGRMFRRLDAHVRRLGAGQVVISPVDVILDRERALVVQPDIVFVSNQRLAICTDRIWGAPDLVVEVLSGSNWRHDRGDKLDWYRTYGVRECWLFDPPERRVEVFNLAGVSAPSRYERGQRIRSDVLPRLRVRPDDVA